MNNNELISYCNCSPFPMGIIKESVFGSLQSVKINECIIITKGRLYLGWKGLNVVLAHGAFGALVEKMCELIVIVFSTLG